MLAGRLHVPAIEALPSLQEVLKADESPVMLVRGAPRSLATMPSPRDITLLVGPEGGWTERELALVEVKAGLGPRNLRADTAALLGVALALAARE
jgi:16S rRNA (uracil1498-N3)-methyltransferase